MAETQKQKLMRLLNCTAEEAEDIMRHDQKVDKGEKTDYDLDPTLEKVAKKFAHVKDHAKKPVIPDSKPRAHKENPTKARLIEGLYQHLIDRVDNLEIINKERQLAFEIEGQKYELTLISKRTPKK